MTLQQLKYVVTVAECGNITEAAKQLFVSQPTVTSAIHDLEKEMQIVIFIRTNKGVNYQKMVRNSLVIQAGAGASGSHRGIYKDNVVSKPHLRYRVSTIPLR